MVPALVPTSGYDRGYAKISERNYAKSFARCIRCNDCVRFGAESCGVVERAGEYSFLSWRRGEEERRRRRRRQRVMMMMMMRRSEEVEEEEARETCPSLHDPVQSCQRVLAITMTERGDPGINAT